MPHIAVWALIWTMSTFLALFWLRESVHRRKERKFFVCFGLSFLLISGSSGFMLVQSLMT